MERERKCIMSVSVVKNETNAPTAHNCPVVACHIFGAITAALCSCVPTFLHSCIPAEINLF